MLVLLSLLCALLLNQTNGCRLVIQTSTAEIIKLRCQCNGEGITTWYKDGNNLIVDNVKYITSKKIFPTLKITNNVTLNDEGKYSCRRGTQTPSPETTLRLNPIKKLGQKVHVITVRPNGYTRIVCGYEIGPVTGNDILRGKSTQKRVELRLSTGKLISKWSYQGNLTTSIVPAFNKSYNDLFEILETDGTTAHNTYLQCRMNIGAQYNGPKYYIKLAPNVSISSSHDGCQLNCTASHLNVTNDNNISLQWRKNGTIVQNGSSILTIESDGPYTVTCIASFQGITQEETYTGRCQTVTSTTVTTSITPNTVEVSSIETLPVTTTSIVIPSSSQTPTEDPDGKTFVEKHPDIAASGGTGFILIIIVIIIGFCVINVRRRNRINSNDNGERGTVSNESQTATTQCSSNLPHSHSPSMYLSANHSGMFPHFSLYNPAATLSPVHCIPANDLSATNKHVPGTPYILSISPNGPQTDTINPDTLTTVLLPSPPAYNSTVGIHVNDTVEDSITTAPSLSQEGQEHSSS